MKRHVTQFDLLTEGLDKPHLAAPSERPFKRTWSYGDVENNGVYYHPQLTHYAHQAFEDFFFANTGLHYVDLSRRTERSIEARREHPAKIKRMTFPVTWLHQFMLEPMEAGDQFHIGVETMRVDKDRIGVRAWVFNDESLFIGLVIWSRAAIELDGKKPKRVNIPRWFPITRQPVVRTKKGGR